MPTGPTHLFIPGPTNVPEAVRRAVNVPMQDHRAPEQLRDELCEVIDLVLFAAKSLGFEDFRVRLSFRDKENPQKYGGADEQWERAQTD